MIALKCFGHDKCSFMRKCENIITLVWLVKFERSGNQLLHEAFETRFVADLPSKLSSLGLSLTCLLVHDIAVCLLGFFLNFKFPGLILADASAPSSTLSMAMT